MNPQLTKLHEDLRTNAMRAQSLCWKHTAEQLAHRPNAASWSAAECISHLTRTTEMFLPKWRTALATTRAAGLYGDGPYSMDLIGKLLDWFLEPPTRIPAKAPKNLYPVITGQELKDFLATQNQWLELVTQADGLALDRVKIGSPVSEIVRYNVWASFCAAEAHQRRHLLQAEHAITPKD